MTLKRQNTTIIDDRHVEALPFPAHINTDPHSHKSSLPHPGRPLQQDAENTTT